MVYLRKSKKIWLVVLSFYNLQNFIKNLSKPVWTLAYGGVRFVVMGVPQMIQVDDHEPRRRIHGEKVDPSWYLGMTAGQTGVNRGGKRVK